MSREQPAQVARSTCAGRTHSAQVVGASRDLLPLPSPRLGRDIISRSRPPGQLSQVAMSIPCPDLPSAQLKPPRSRPQKLDRDTNFNRPGRDLKSMSRPASVFPVEKPLSKPKTLVATPDHHHAAITMLRHQIGVATSPRQVQAATSKMMSRPPISSTLA